VFHEEKMLDIKFKQKEQVASGSGQWEESSCSPLTTPYLPCRNLPALCRNRTPLLNLPENSFVKAK
jgi:hypothetical protein